MSDSPNPRARRLREAGYKLTNARLTVLHVLEDRHEHLTSTEIVEAVSAADPEIGRASVFRSLDLFTRLGIVRPTYVESSLTPRYVMMPDGHHHHIICTQCNRLIEFEDCHVEELQTELERRFDLTITGHLLEFYAVCANCRE